MAMKGPDNLISELGNWNSAMIYAISEIAKPLAMTTVYRDIAKHGYSSFIEDITSYGIPRDKLRLDGFKWLVTELLKVIENSKSFLKIKGTKDEIEKYEKKLIQIEKLIELPILYKITTDRNGNKKVRLFEDKFNAVLDIVLKIRTDIKTPLNKNDLIFINREEFDPQEYKRQMIEDATLRG